jgi:hypothetical protein
MRGVLGEQRLAQGLAHRRLSASVAAALAAQDADRVLPLAQRPVIPPLDGRDAEADRVAAHRVAPVARRQRLERRAQGALLRRRRQ